MGHPRLIVAHDDDWHVARHRVPAHDLGAVHMPHCAGRVPLGGGVDLADSPVTHRDPRLGQTTRPLAVEPYHLVRLDLVIVRPVSPGAQIDHTIGGHVHLELNIQAPHPTVHQVELGL